MAERSAQHAADAGEADRPRVSLVKAGRPAHARDEEPKHTPGQDLVPARGPRTAGPAHAGAPTYRPRHAKRHRRRWPALLAAGLVLVALAGVGAAVLANRQDDETDRATAPAATNVAPAPVDRPAEASGVPSAAASGTAVPPVPAAPAPGTAECRYTPTPDKTPPIVPPARATRSGLVKATIGTSRGPLTLELDATNAPCTVESFLTLAAGGYFNDTACHRLTTQLIFVLQCGDPTALGSGDPGYSFDDENLPAPGGTPYPRGTLAMANAGPDTNGSQFFIVYKDSPIDPNYPVFGKVTGGLEIVDRVAAGGAPGNDGQPNESLVIQAVQIS
jgi:peptidyl-prolyl cis-trans isomerase B (cyclophilin B)